MSEVQKKQKGRKTYLWRRVKGFLEFHILSSWESLYQAIIQGSEFYSVIIDTS